MLVVIAWVAVDMVGVEEGLAWQSSHVLVGGRVVHERPLATEGSIWFRTAISSVRGLITGHPPDM